MAVQKFDVVIIGGGVSGTAAAYQLLQKNADLRILVIERGTGHRLGQTGHNSGVFHSPLNYKPGSLKAKNCAKGRELLQPFCEQRGVPLEICGKLLVATEAWEEPLLYKKWEQAIANDIAGAKLIDADEVKEREPHVTLARKGLLIPGTGVIDFGRVAEELGKCVVEAGSSLVFETSVTGLRRQGSGWLVQTDKEDYEARLILNCAGIQSDRITKMAGLRPKGRIIPIMGVYYEVTGKAADLVKTIVYPLPHPKIPVLGIHVHRMIDGRVFAGPNAVVVYDRERYKFGSFNGRDILDMVTYSGFWLMMLRNIPTGIKELRRSGSMELFAREVQKLVPGITAADLKPAIPGIRAQLVDWKGTAFDDFVFTEGKNIICCESVASPGATACMQNGDLLADMALAQLA